MKKRKKTIIIILALMITAGAMSSYFVHKKLISDPNYLIKKTAVRLSEGKSRKASYNFGHLYFLADKRMPVYEFRPSEDAEYDFEISDIQTDSGDLLLMSVLDKSLAEYLSLSSASEEEGGDAGSMTGSVFLQKGRRYYVLIDAAYAENGRRHRGSFTISVNRSEEEEKPAEISEDQSVTVKIGTGGQANISFAPRETGYYIFDSDIVSKNASTGFSVISGYTTEGGEFVPAFDGICRLEAGASYYILACVEEIKGGTAEVEVKCRRLETKAFDENGSAGLSSASIIEYTTEKDERVLFHSVSEGNPKVTVYDSEGFPVRSDDNSGEEFGGGKKDFAVMINAEKGKEYRIYVYGKIKNCTVNAVRYASEEEQAGTAS